MTRKKINRTPNSDPIRRERDPLPWRYCLLAVVCGLFLVLGFFGAARQHFASMDFGIKNSKLRKQIEELESEKRRLLLSKEIALSPPEIKKAAKKIGLTQMTANNIQAYSAQTAKSEPVSPAAKKTAGVKPIAESSTKQPEIKRSAEPKPGRTADATDDAARPRNTGR